MLRIFRFLHTLPVSSFGASQAPKKIMRTSVVPAVGASL